MPQPRRALLLRPFLFLLPLLFGCGLLGPDLSGQWETEATPKRTLDLRKDGSYTLRFSGKTLGVLSDVLGPEAGTWRIDGDALVLTHKNESGVENATRLPIHESSRDTLVLGDDRWRRRGTAVAGPPPAASPRGNGKDQKKDKDDDDDD